MSVEHRGRSESERGPGWYDVASQMRYMEKHYTGRIVVEARASTSRNGGWGLLITARLVEVSDCHGHGSYGTAYPGNGQKTVAAAYFRALLALDELLAKRWLEEALMQPGLPLD